MVFGHAIKNGQLPPNTELTTFEHKCGTPPCAITQLHFPSIYPTGSCPWNWENGRFRVYVDGEANPSIDVALHEIALIGHLGAVGNTAADGSPFGNALFGKTAASGAVYTTVRIPFSQSVRTTQQAAAGVTCNSVYWYIVRGVEGMPVTLGSDFLLPDQARLSVFRQDNVTLAPLQYIEVAVAPQGTAGAVVASMFDTVSGDPNYLEACGASEVVWVATCPLSL